MRGIGVAVMEHVWARPSASAERCSTPKRCCSSTTATARSRSSKPFWISACADDDVRVLRRLGLHRPGDERAADVGLGADALDREEVLLRQRLGRRHQRPAARPRPRGGACRGRRPSCPSRRRPAVAVASASSGRGRGRAGDRRLLVLGQLERENSPVAVDQLPGLGQRDRDLVLPLGGSAGESELEHEQLAEGEPLPSASASSSERGWCTATSASARSGRPRSTSRAPAAHPGGRARGRARP